MKKTNVGILGFGLAGTVFHAPLIQSCQDMVLKSVGSRSFDGKKIPEGVQAQSFDQIIDDPEIDLIVVATTNISHYPLARKALLAGKHVVVDKPFVTRSPDADALIELAADKQRVLSVYQNRRWDAGFRTAQKIIHSEQLGTISYGEFHFDRFAPEINTRWREQPNPGSGLVFDLGSHLIDQVYCMFGMPKAVTADVTTQRGGLVDDFFHILLDYGTLRVVAHATSLANNHAPRIALYGDNGCFQFFGLDGQETDLQSGKMPSDPGWGTTDGAKALLHSISGDVTEIETLPGSYEAYYQGVADAIQSKAQVPVPAEEARDTMRILEASIRSGVERRTIALI